MSGNTYASAVSVGVDTTRLHPLVPKSDSNLSVPKSDNRQNCVVCGEWFPMHPRGWARRYCGANCKDKAWRRSHIEAERAQGRKWWATHSQDRNAQRRTPEHRLRQRIRRARRLAEAENERRDRRAKIAKLFRVEGSHVGV